MPRRSFARPVRRRTNWIGEVNNTNSQTVGEESYFQLFTNQWTEIEKYVNPTLVRIRGQILVAPAFAQTEASEATYVHCGIYVAPSSSVDGIDIGAGDVSSDRIIWTGSIGFVKRGTTLTTSGGKSLSIATCPALEVDVKAMRKLGDDQKLWMYIGAPIDTAAGAAMAYQLRALIME